MAKRGGLLIGIAAAVLVAGGSAATFASTAARAPLFWGKGIEAALPADARTGASSTQTVAIDSISCASAGNCSAVGSYTATSGSTEALLLTETAGKWARGAEAPLPANAASTDQDAELDSVSCASAGNCAAVGFYQADSGSQEGLLLTETAGTWATGVEAALPSNAADDALVFLNSVSCASAGNCSAVGGYNSAGGGADDLLLTETAGTWGTGVAAALPANAATPDETGLNAVSCASAGNCTAVGGYQDSSGQSLQGLLVTETAGTWGTGIEALPPSDADTTDPGVFLVAVSCPSVGNCGAVGDYNLANLAGTSFMVAETAGSWTRGVEAALPRNAWSPHQSDLNDISCASAGNCAAVGGYADRRGDLQGLAVSETAGSWSKGSEAVLPADAAADPDQLAGLESVSCVSAGNCVAVGDYADDSDTGQGLLLPERAGRWATGAEARSPSNVIGSFLDSVSCPSARSCSAVGGFGDIAGSQHGLLIGTTKAPPCVVPRLKGKTLTAAKRSIRAHVCSVGRIRHAASRKVKKGRVISQRPKPGSRRQYGAKVSLVVSKGRGRRS